ncbi:ankyrin repeat-containing domain protein [Mycena amicta]|nr:ankyrin repeat-containing domain protein [Mycena amicta]
MTATRSSYLTSILPPELILLIGETLPPSSLNALTQTCTHLHSILQATLETSLTPEMAPKLLLRAASTRKRDAVCKLLAPPFSTDPNTPYWNGWTPLHAAAHVGDRYIVQELLDAGADVNRRQDDYNGVQPLYGAVVGGHVDAARLLLEHGAEVTAWGEGKLHPLEEAVYTGNAEMVGLLLDHGADADAQGQSGRAIIERAAQTDNFPILQLLLAAGANPDNIDLHISEIWPAPEGEESVLRLLLVHGATGPMETVMQNLKRLAEEEGITEDELLAEVNAHFASIVA